MQLIDSITYTLKYLESQKGSNNILGISRKLDELSLLTVTLGNEVANAYELMGELEDDYKIKYSQYIADSLNSVAKAEKYAEAKLGEEKKSWTQAKNGYKKLSMLLERCDRVIETHRQTLSILKLETKNI